MSWKNILKTKDELHEGGYDEHFMEGMSEREKGEYRGLFSGPKYEISLINMNTLIAIDMSGHDRPEYIANRWEDIKEAQSEFRERLIKEEFKLSIKELTGEYQDFKTFLIELQKEYLEAVENARNRVGGEA